MEGPHVDFIAALFHLFSNNGKVEYRHWTHCRLSLMWTCSIMIYYVAWGSDHPDMDLPITLFLWPLFRVCSLELKFGVSKGQSKMWQSFQLSYYRSKDLQLGVSNLLKCNQIRHQIRPSHAFTVVFLCVFTSYSSRGTWPVHLWTWI